MSILYIQLYHASDFTFWNNKTVKKNNT